MTQHMTVDELSELGEALAVACSASVRPVRPLLALADGESSMDCCCPLGALSGLRFPTAVQAAEAIGIPERSAAGFINGYEASFSEPDDDAGAFTLGCAFRELYP